MAQPVVAPYGHMKKLTLRATTLRHLTPDALQRVAGGTLTFPTTLTPNSRNCGSFAEATCNVSIDVCPTDRCGPSVNNSPEC